MCLTFWITIQTALEIEEAKQRKAAEAEQRRIDEQQIEALQTVRRNAEIAKDQEDKRMKKEKEREMARYVVVGSWKFPGHYQGQIYNLMLLNRMKERIEQEHDLTLKREQLRLLRQQEAEDRKIRKQELVKFILSKYIPIVCYLSSSSSSSSSCHEMYPNWLYELDFQESGQWDFFCIWLRL